MIAFDVLTDFCKKVAVDIFRGFRYTDDMALGPYGCPDA